MSKLPATMNRLHQRQKSEVATIYTSDSDWPHAHAPDLAEAIRDHEHQSDISDPESASSASSEGSLGRETSSEDEDDDHFLRPSLRPLQRREGSAEVPTLAKLSLEKASSADTASEAVVSADTETPRKRPAATPRQKRPLPERQPSLLSKSWRLFEFGFCPSPRQKKNPSETSGNDAESEVGLAKLERCPSRAELAEPTSVSGEEVRPDAVRSVSEPVPSTSIAKDLDKVDGKSDASKECPTANSEFPSPAAQNTFVANSDHLRMLSIEYLMMRNNKIVGPLKPRAGHWRRAELQQSRKARSCSCLRTEVNLA